MIRLSGSQIVYIIIASVMAGFVLGYYVRDNVIFKIIKVKKEKV